MNWIVFLTITLVTLCGCASMDDHARGISDARKRLRNGELVKTMRSGFYSFSDETPKYWRILREEYGIAHEMALGRSDEYVDGFASVMNPEIEKQFDSDFFENIWKRAQNDYEVKKR